MEDINSFSAEIVAAIKENKESVLKDFYVENFAKVRRFILRNGGNHADAEDFFQEAYLIVWKNVKKGEYIPQGGTSINGYLYRIAQNKWRDYLRSSEYRKTIRDDEIKNNPSTEPSVTEANADLRIKLIQDTFSELGERCEELLKYFYYERKSMKWLAQKYNWTEASAKNNKYRCLKKLRELIKSKTK